MSKQTAISGKLKCQRTINIEGFVFAAVCMKDKLIQWKEGVQPDKDF